MADRDVYWTGAVSTAAATIGNWQMFDGSPLTHLPGEWNDGTYQVTTHDRMFFLGARRVRECTNWNGSPPACGLITRGIEVDQAYATLCGSYNIGGGEPWCCDNKTDPTMSVPGDLVLKGAGHLYMDGLWGWYSDQDIHLYGTSTIEMMMPAMATPQVYLYSGIHVISPWFGFQPIPFHLMAKDAVYVAGYEMHEVGVDSGLVIPGVGNVRKGTTFGFSADQKAGTLVVPRRLVAF